MRVRAAGAAVVAHGRRPPGRVWKYILIQRATLFARVARLLRALTEAKMGAAGSLSCDARRQLLGSHSRMRSRGASHPFALQ